MNNYFTTLNNVNVNDKTEKKNGLTYLSWAWAWGEVKKLYPDTVILFMRTISVGITTRITGPHGSRPGSQSTASSISNTFP